MSRTGLLATFLAMTAVVIVAAHSPLDEARAGIINLGDANCDGVVNPVDSTFILQFSAGLIGALPCPQNGDASGDGSTNPLDSALILQFSAGLIDSLNPVAPTSTNTPPLPSPPTNTPAPNPTATPTTVVLPPVIDFTTRCAEELYDWAQSLYTSLIAKISVEAFCGSHPDVFTGGSSSPISVDDCADALYEWAISEFTSTSAEQDVDLSC